MRKPSSLFRSFFSLTRRSTLPAIVLLPVIAARLSSCSPKDCAMNPGVTTSETRELSPFSEIVLNGKINLFLTQDSVQQVTISAGKNLLTNIETVVSENILTIQDNNSCLLQDPSDVVNLYISSAQLQKLTYYGAGDVHSTNTLQAAQFTVDCWEGSGTIQLDLQTGLLYADVRNENATIRLSGTTGVAFVYCAEAGSVDIGNVTSPIVSVQNNSIRDVTVNVTDSLYADIAYKGNVYYKGSPRVIDTLVSNTGRLIYQP